MNVKLPADNIKDVDTAQNVSEVQHNTIVFDFIVFTFNLTAQEYKIQEHAACLDPRTETQNVLPRVRRATNDYRACATPTLSWSAMVFLPVVAETAPCLPQQYLHSHFSLCVWKVSRWLRAPTCCTGIVANSPVTPFIRSFVPQ